jgi:hypothetical protein
MRCLYCGKGLALLKRLRGGGEFCSDAHRLKYQEEYNQLALSRLLQAHPPDEAAKSNEPLKPQSSAPNGLNGLEARTGSSDLKPGSLPHRSAPALSPVSSPASSGVSSGVSSEPGVSRQVKSTPMAPATATAEREPVTRTPEPVRKLEPAEFAKGVQPIAAQAQPEVAAPAPMVGFVAELPLPQQAETRALMEVALEFAVVVRPEPPSHDALVAPHEPAADEAPAWAERVALGISAHSADAGFTIRSTGVEVRESTRTTPVTMPSAALQLVTSGPGGGGASSDWADTEWARRDQPLDFTLPPVALESAGSPWLGSAHEFAPLSIELGDLGRLGLATEEFAEIGSRDQVAQPAPAAEEPDPQHAPAAPMSIEPQRHDPSDSVRSAIEPVHIEPAHIESPQAETVQIDRAFLQSLVNLELSPVQTSQPAGAAAQAHRQAPADIAHDTARVDGAHVDGARRATPVEEASPVPERVTRPLPLTLHGFPPGRGKRAQIFTAGLRAVPEIQIPSTGALPLRPLMLFGPAPAAPAPSSPAAPAPAPVVDDPKAKAPRGPDVVAAPLEETAKARTDPRTSPRKPQKPGERVIDTAKLRRAEPAAGVGSPTIAKSVPAPELKPAKAEPVEVKPAAKTEPKPDLKPEPQLEPKLEPKSEPKLEPKSEPKLERKPEPKRATVESAAPVAEPVASVDLGLPSLQLDANKSRRPAPAVFVVVLAVVGAIGAGVYYLGGKTSTPVPTKPVAPVSDVVDAGSLSLAEAGWIEDWAPQPPNPKMLRVLSILRGSLPLSDYRMEFEAQIESKALGWVYRALNPKNYYVTRLEVVKPGIEPTVEVVHFAMIDGDEQTRVRVPLPVKVRVDTTYKVRFEALGDRFTTYVQDQKVDEWNDNRIGRGGAGLYRERGESALLKGTVRMTLIAKKK